MREFLKLRIVERREFQIAPAHDDDLANPARAQRRQRMLGNIGLLENRDIGRQDAGDVGGGPRATAHVDQRSHDAADHVVEETVAGDVDYALRKRGKKWAYWVDVGKDPATGKRKQVSKSGFETEMIRTPPENMREIIQTPTSLPGISDGGAHTKFVTTGRYPTDLLSYWVREEKIMELEEAHWRLSGLAAQAAGLRHIEIGRHSPEKLLVQALILRTGGWGCPAARDRFVAALTACHLADPYDYPNVPSPTRVAQHVCPHPQPELPRTPVGCAGRRQNPTGAGSRLDGRGSVFPVCGGCPGARP